MSQKRLPSKKRITIIVTGVLVVLVLSLIGYGIYLYITAENMMSDSHHDLKREADKSLLRDEAVSPVSHNISILFIGIDTGEERKYEEASRSDALLLATFNREEGSVKLLSIPRDTYVYIPDMEESTKINHAHFYGGPKSTMETIESFLHVPIDYYVRLNFEAFIDIVDAIGGINYDVPFEVYELDSHDNKNAIHLLPGNQRLNGEEALAMVRTRKHDSDIERGKRQQEIMKQIAIQTFSLSNLFRLDDVITSIGPNMKTDLTFQDIKTLFEYGMKNKFDIQTVNLEGDASYADDGLWYFYVDEESRIEISNELRAHLNLSLKDYAPPALAGEE